MKKLFYRSLCLALLASGSLLAQSPLAQKQSQFNFGVGFSSWGLPFYLGLDYGIHPDISLGGELSYRSYRENWKNDYYNHNVIGLSANGNYHFNRILSMPSNWNFYAGLNIGFYAWSSPNDYLGNNNTGLGLGGQIGGRYFFNNRWGLNLEFGGGNAFSGGKFGLTMKL